MGLKHGSKLEKTVWEQFNNNWNELAYNSELIISQRMGNLIDDKTEDQIFPSGKERIAIVKQRINQKFFRTTVLASYNQQCCITGIPITDLLIASHIKPWSIDKANRINPRNGLCLNAFHDKAFDSGYITITPDYVVKLSDELDKYSNNRSVINLLIKHNNKKITIPDRFVPEKEFLDYHYTQIFRK
ncbi:MAG: HNH endonuclease [Kiritimatiellia bacterium]